jgi:hypothetical protein
MVKTLEKPKLVNTIFEFFKHVSEWVGPSAHTPTIQELEKYLASNLQMFNNGNLVLKSAAEYLERLKKLQKMYYKMEVSKPLEEPLIQDDRASVYYKLDLTTQDGHHKEVFILGLLTIKHDKISRWVEVTSVKDAANWDTLH